MPGVPPPFGRNYGRSMVVSVRGIAATSQVLASQAGAATLARGGSAADAAIAANAVLGVVEPMMNGLGGDLFVLYWEAKSRTLYGLNASGSAPRALTAEGLPNATVMPEDGIHSVTVPGAVDGWSRIHARFGKLPWNSLFDQAIAHATEGFAVPEVVSALWNDPAAVVRLRTHSEAARVFLPAGAPPKCGGVFRNPDLARALTELARGGADAYYRGPIAAAIVKASDALAGTMTLDDLAAQQAEWVLPISTTYRGWRVFELPPNGQGMAALEMLNILEASGDAAVNADSAGAWHARIEAMKLAYADVYRYNADPRFARVPVETLVSKEYARQRAALIDSRRANGAFTHGEAPAGDTVYLTTADREGNIASWIQSVFGSFGSAITVPGYGFVLQNRGAGFSLDPRHPNVLAGGKRPFHTIIPGFLQRPGRNMGFGIMGGANQPLAHAQFVSNVVDHGMNLQAAMEAPRFFKGSAAGLGVAIESRAGEAVLRDLAARGHELAILAEYSQQMGRGQAILHDEQTGVRFAASDPRADGCALPEPLHV